MLAKSREQIIAHWLARVERSPLSAPRFFAQHRLPFSLSQYYVYRRKFAEGGPPGLYDQRQRGNHRRLNAEVERYVEGYVSAEPHASLQALREEVRHRFDLDLTLSGISRCLKRLGLTLKEKKAAVEPAGRYTPYAGFELILALACHFRWPQETAQEIRRVMAQAKPPKPLGKGEGGMDRAGRNRQGQFTARYNRRREVRRKRFASIEMKRQSKRLESMSVCQLKPQALARRCVAILALPLITHNGMIRSVDGAQGIGLKTLCGFRYKQSTLNKFLAELKYLGVSQALLRHQVGFWQQRWQEVAPVDERLALVCYYVDGNTKALWSSQSVQKNKVSMLGRVMGCLEQVFVHDPYGRPIYFETHSGHAPSGEYILSLFDKIEGALEGWGAPLQVNRAIVMDGASNSVRTLRAFAAQKKYHYITSLDTNQWDRRKVRREGPPQRYRYGPATLRECEIELEDSQDKGYLFVTRALKIHWDRGKETYLITSLPCEVIGASTVVKAYFDRWPDQELSFKVMKSVASLHRVAGYGKQKVARPEVVERQKQLCEKIRVLKKRLAPPRAQIETREAQLDTLIKTEQRLKAQSRIEDGRRILPQADSDQLEQVGQEIAKLERQVKRIQNADPAFKELEKAEQEWLRLQGKETVYKVDVELDQIMTFFRASLVNLEAYLAHLMGVSRLSLSSLLARVLCLPGRVVETPTSKQILLERNDNDPETIERLSRVIPRLNDMRINTITGRIISFGLK